MNKALIILTLVFIVGCTPTMNRQKASLRAGADITVTVILDKRPAATIEGDKVVILTVVNQLRDLINDGDATNITLGIIREQLINIIPAEYQLVANQVLAAISGIRVESTAIGFDNIKRINAVLDGIVTAVGSYEVEDRGPEPSQ